MPGRVVCRPFQNDDLEGVIDLSFKVLNTANRSREELKRLWVWKFETNPYHSPSVPQGFVLEQEGRILGYIGQLAAPMKLGSAVTVAYAGHAYCVDEEFRGHGLKLTRAFARNAGAPEEHRVFLFVHFKKFLREFVKRRPALPRTLLDNEILLSVASIPIDLFFKVGGVLNIPRERLKTVRVEIFGSEFDGFWREVSSHYDILVVRDSKYLNWRYIDYPFQKPEAFSTYDSRRRLRGFAVLGVTGPDSNGTRMAIILELFTRPDDVSAQQELLSAALAYAREQDVDGVRAGFFPPQVGRLLRKNLFLLRRDRHSACLFKSNGMLPDHVLCDERNWFLSLGDGDASF